MLIPELLHQIYQKRRTWSLKSRSFEYNVSGIILKQILLESFFELFSELVHQKFLNIIIVSINIHIHVILEFLEDEDFARCFRKSTNADLIQLIVLEESFNFNLSPSSAVNHFFDYLIIPELSHEWVAGSEDAIASLLDRKDHFFKNQIVHVIVVYQSCTCYIIKLIFKNLGQVVGRFS